MLVPYPPENVARAFGRSEVIRPLAPFEWDCRIQSHFLEKITDHLLLPSRGSRTKHGSVKLGGILRPERPERVEPAFPDHLDETPLTILSCLLLGITRCRNRRHRNRRSNRFRGSLARLERSDISVVERLQSLGGEMRRLDPGELVPASQQLLQGLPVSAAFSRESGI
jgi:hypothetical protein